MNYSLLVTGMTPLLHYFLDTSTMYSFDVWEFHGTFQFQKREFVTSSVWS